MWCMICENHLANCICEDLDERLESVFKKGSFVFKKCKKCNLHYERCECKEPEWELSKEKTK